MRLTLFLLSALACRVLDARNTVGFYILGAHLTNLKFSMAQRIEHATGLALGRHGNDDHIYFVSGYKNPNGGPSEAEHMENEIQRIYGAAGRKSPRIVSDYEARFTVMNFLKTIPMINEWRKTLSLVYMVTSDYHIPRSRAILQEFQNAGLTADVRYVVAGAPHPRNSKHAKRMGIKFDKWLLSDCNGRTRLEDILDATRDRDNANIFATLCQRQSSPLASLRFLVFWESSSDVFIERYLRNNAADPRPRDAKIKQLKKLVSDFVAA